MRRCRSLIPSSGAGERFRRAQGSERPLKLLAASEKRRKVTAVTVDAGVFNHSLDDSSGEVAEWSKAPLC